MFSVAKSCRFSRIVLASGSPRRSEILKTKGGLTDLVIIPSTFEEQCKGQFDPSEVYKYITGIAFGKVTQVARLERSKVDKSVFNGTLFIGADTVVLKNGKVYEKPTDREDAISMLKGLRDEVDHQVCTGVVLLVPNPTPASPDEEFLTHIFHETTDVKFGAITDDVIERYVDTGECMDKAGGYGIQALGAQLMESINGDYYNVMGFPLYKFCKELEKFIESIEKSTKS